MINLIKKLVKSIRAMIVKVIDTVAKFIRKSVIRTKSAREDDDIGFLKLDDCWEVAVGDYKKHKKDAAGFKTMVEEFNKRQQENYEQVGSGKKIKIIFHENIDQISVVKQCNTEENPHVQIVSSGNRVGAVVSVKMLNIKFSATCAHVLTLMDFNDSRNYVPVNEHIVVDCNVKLLREYFWIIKTNDEIMWWTKDLTAGKHTYIMLEVHKPILGYVLCKGRRKLSCIGIITAIKAEVNYVYSGSIMVVNKKPFIVTYTHTSKNGVISIVALGIIPHDHIIVA